MQNRITIGMDLGDKSHTLCVLDEEANVTQRTELVNTRKAIKVFFTNHPNALVAMEAGTQSAWIEREIVALKLGHEVVVGNPRKLRVIWSNENKYDDNDAELLARVARSDRKLMHAIHHRSAQAQQDLAVIQARDTLVRTRSCMVNHVRSAVKGVGERVPQCGAEAFPRKARTLLVDNHPLSLALLPILEVITQLTERIKAYDKQIEALAAERYPAAKRLTQPAGVGTLTALTFMLLIDDSSRFKSSRQVGPFFGLVPRRDQSGQTDKQLGITKAGNMLGRRLLVGSAHYILGHFGPDSDLRRFGLSLAARGGKNAKKRAVTAVARKLSVLLHRLWITGEDYRPLREVQELKAVS